jgi:hypothetical protein
MQLCRPGPARAVLTQAFLRLARQTRSYRRRISRNSGSGPVSMGEAEHRRVPETSVGSGSRPRALAWSPLRSFGLDPRPEGR